MLYPSIDELLEHLDSKYSLVVAASKRARSLRDGAVMTLEEVKSNKFVGAALEEIYHGTVKYQEVK